VSYPTDTRAPCWFVYCGNFYSIYLFSYLVTLLLSVTIFLLIRCQEIVLAGSKETSFQISNPFSNVWIPYLSNKVQLNRWLPVLYKYSLEQCFSTAGLRAVTGPWHQLRRAAKDFPGSCHFSFLSIFHEYILYSGNILRRIIFVNVSKSSFH